LDDLIPYSVKLFGEYGNGKAIEDPYYGGKSGFETTYKQVLAYSEGLLDSLNLPSRPTTNGSKS